MKVTVEVSSQSKGAKITKGDKSIDPSDLFGMWKDNPQSIENIRQKAWQRSEI
jgi:hypothetical protein